MTTSSNSSINGSRPHSYHPVDDKSPNEKIQEPHAPPQYPAMSHQSGSDIPLQPITPGTDLETATPQSSKASSWKTKTQKRKFSFTKPEIAAVCFWFLVLLGEMAFGIALLLTKDEDEAAKKHESSMKWKLPDAIFKCLLFILLMMVGSNFWRVHCNRKRWGQKDGWVDGIFWHTVVIGAVVVGFACGCNSE